MCRDPAVDLARPLDAADPLPEARPVVEVVGHDRAVTFGRSDRLDDDLRRRVGERGEDPARVEPAHPQRAEEVIPVDISRPQLRGGGVAAIGYADRPADAEASFREIEAVADRPPDTVRRNPADQARVDPALKHEILEQPADIVVGERCHDRRPLTEAPTEPPGDVVLTASLPRLEPAGGADAPLTRIEAQHDLAERDEVVPALARRANGEAAHCATSAARTSASRVSRVTAVKSRAAISSGATIQLPPTARTDGSAR